MKDPGTKPTPPKEEKEDPEEIEEEVPHFVLEVQDSTIGVSGE